MVHFTYDVSLGVTDKTHEQANGSRKSAEKSEILGIAHTYVGDAQARSALFFQIVGEKIEGLPSRFSLRVAGPTVAFTFNFDEPHGGTNLLELVRELP